MAHSIVGLFPDRGSAERASGDLKAAGFETDRSGSVTRDGEGTSYLQSGVEPGWVFVTVEAQGRDAEARQILLHAGAQRLGPEGSGASADEDTIGGVAPPAVSDAPHAPTVPPIGDIGGVAPSAVTDAPPPAEQDTLARRPPTAPADTTIVSPGVETPSIQRQDRAGQTAAGRPVTDDDIIAQWMRQREQHAMPDQSDHSSQSADLDVAPDADEASPAERGG